MKKILLRALVSLLCLIPISVYATDGFKGTLAKAGKSLLLPTIDTSQKIFPTHIQEKETKLKELQKEKKQLEEAEEEFDRKTQKQSEEIKQQLERVTEALRHDAEDEFLNKELVILNERLQLQKNLQLSRDQLAAIVDENIALLQEYLKDPSLKEFNKELNITSRNVYSLEDLQQLSHLIVEKERAITQLQEQEKNADLEIENRKHTATATAESYRKKVEEQASLSSSKQSVDHDLVRKAELLKLEEHLFADKNERDILRLKEVEYKKALIKTKIVIERQHLDVLKEALARVKPAIKVSEADVALARDELIKKQQQAVGRTEQFTNETETIVKEIKLLEKTLQELQEHHGIEIAADIDEWERKPKETAQGYVQLVELGMLNDTLLLLQRKKELSELHNALEDEKLHLEAVEVDIKQTFHKTTARKFVSEAEAVQERKQYDERRTEVKATISLFKEQRITAQERLQKQKKALINVKELRQRLYEKKNTLFRTNPELYTSCLAFLNEAEEKIQQQIDVLQQAIGIAGDIVALLQEVNKRIDFIITELELTTIWQRSKYAITWEGVQKIVPDLESFVAGIRSYVSTIKPKDALFNTAHAVTQRHTAGMLLVELILIILLIIGLKRLLPFIGNSAIHFAHMHRNVKGISLFFALIINFLAAHCASIVLWCAIVVRIHYLDFADPYPYILLYLLSIPYLLYLANRFIHYFEQFNRHYDYIFISKQFEWRLMMVATTLLYSTITILFFREAFLLSGNHKSELPNILLALNFIIFQIALIFLIAKEWVLNIIPTHGEFWRWIMVQVDRFYYLILMFAIAIIVMSNPYVGFGKLVFYVLMRVIYTIILLRVLLWLNGIFKQSLSYVFFSRSGQDYMKERFAYAKTMYGFFAVAIMLFFLIIAGIVGAKIWGWPETLANINKWSDLMSLLQTPIILEKTDNPISIFSILKILFFIFVGFLVAFVVDRFVIEKIFDALLVEPGVQNTISSLVRYVVLIISIIFGFQSVGLGELVWILIGGLIVGVGWVIKEPVGDFVAYFIILVQRPVKIGDYIKIDDETFGVVRKITARSVVVRKKNSTTIMLPNTMVINKPIINWNYGRGFTAFEDILITISYKEDPAKVKELIQKVLDENTFILKSPTPIVRLENFSEHGYVFMVRGFLSSNYTLDQWEIASDVRLAIVKRLREHGITIAIPARFIVTHTAGADTVRAEKQISG